MWRFPCLHPRCMILSTIRVRLLVEAASDMLRFFVKCRVSVADERLWRDFSVLFRAGWRYPLDINLAAGGAQSEALPECCVWALVLKRCRSGNSALVKQARYGCAVKLSCNVRASDRTVRNEFVPSDSPPRDFESDMTGSTISAFKDFHCDLYGRRINFTNSQNLVGRCRDRPSSASLMTCTNVKFFFEEMK